MPDQKLLRVLNEMGLSDKEALVYYSALRLGPTGVSRIARTTGIKRTTVYSIIESLRQKSLMNIELTGFKKRYVAEHPERLEAMVESRRNLLKNVLPEFSALYNLKGGESSIKFYEGLSAMKEVYEGLLNDVRPGDEYMIISAMQQWYNLDPDYFQRFTERRGELSRRLGFRIRLLVEETPISREHKRIERSLSETIKFLPKETKLTTNLVVISKKVVIHQLVPPINAIIIDNPNIIRMHRELFEILWASIPLPKNDAR